MSTPTERDLLCDRILVLEREGGTERRQYPIPADMEAPETLILGGQRFYRVSILRPTPTIDEGSAS